MTRLRRATAGDVAALDAFLAPRTETSMFLRSNLARHGAEDQTDPHGTTLYVSTTAGVITGVFGRTNGGFLLAQAPQATTQDWQAFAALLAGQTVRGMTGVPAQVAACLSVLNLPDDLFSLNADEPLYTLEVQAMAAVPAKMRRATDADVPMLAEWFHGYEVDVRQAAAGAPISDRTRARARQAVDNPDVALLTEAGVPVAMAGLNARVDDTVQIGGVYTPPDLRGRGYARRAVAGLLRQTVQRGIARAVLFASSVAAARAYEAIGFQRRGSYRVALLHTPTQLPERPA